MIFFPPPKISAPDYSICVIILLNQVKSDPSVYVHKDKSSRAHKGFLSHTQNILTETDKHHYFREVHLDSPCFSEMSKTLSLERIF